MKKRIAIGVVIALLALMAAGMYGALRSERGLNWLARSAEQLSNGRIKIGVIQGELLGESRLQDFHFAAADGTTVDIRRVHLAIQPREFLAGRLHVLRLEAEGLQIRLPPATPPDSEPIKLPSTLPFALIVDSATLDGLDIWRLQAPLFHLDRGSVAGSWLGGEIKITRLDTAFPDTGPLQLAVKGRMRADRIEFADLLLKGPGEVSGSGVLALESSHGDFKLQWRDARWPPVSNNAQPQIRDVKGELHVTGSLDKYVYELGTDAIVRDVPAKLAAHGSGSLEHLRIDDLGVTADKGSVRAQGKVAWSPALRADVQAQIAQLNPKLFAQDWDGVLNGALRTQTTMRGEQPDIAFDLQLEHSTLLGQPLTLSARGDSDPHRAHVEQLRLQAAGGSVSASGDVTWAPALTANFDATFAKLNPKIFSAAWPGEINGTVKLRTAPRDGAPDLRFDAQVDRSQLRGYPLRLSARGDFYRQAVTLEELNLSSSTTTLSASGRATPPFDLRGKLNSPDLAALYPEIGGRAAFDFSLQGPLDDPHVVTRGDASGLRWKTYRVGKLDWDADVTPRAPSHVTVTTSKANAGWEIASAKLSATGVETYQDIKLDAMTERGALNLALAGGYDRKRREWGGNWESARVAPTDLPEWKLEQSAGLLLGAQRQSLEPACLGGAGGRLCLRLEQNVTRQGLRLSWNLERLLLAAFKPLLPPDEDVQGQINGEGHIEIAGGDVVSVDTDLKLGPARIARAGKPALEILPSTLQADQQNDRLHGVLDLRFAQGSVVADVAAAPAESFSQRTLSGHIDVSVPDLSFLEDFMPELKSVGGDISGSLQLAGSAGLPRVHGQVLLDHGHARLATPGIELQQVRVGLRGNGEGPLAIEGSMRSGEGSITIAGTVDPAHSPLRADVTVKGENFQAAATPDARIWVTPDLKLSSGEGGIHLDGNINVPKAEITPKELGDEGVPISGDQVIVGAEEKPAAELKIFSTVHLMLGDAVSFNGLGLTTRMEGAVTVIDEPLRDTSGRGELRLVDGHYKAYGQDLSIETGRLIFNGGPITKPAVDLYATRRPQQDITVGVRVRGTLAKPLLTLQSDPAMPREQQLSWLVLGRSLDSSSASDRSMVSQAAMSLGLSGGDYLAQRLGKGIGLDQIMIGQGPISGPGVAADAGVIQGSQASLNRGTSTYTTRAAQLTLGKYLTPKLFVSYGVSLFQQGQVFRLVYDLGGGFKLQTESGVASGGDLIYTIER